MSDSEHWSIQDSAELYGLDRWGDPYFSINGRGHISVQPQGDRGGSLDLVTPPVQEQLLLLKLHQ